MINPERPYRVLGRCPFGTGHALIADARDEAEAEVFASMAREDGWETVTIERKEPTVKSLKELLEEGRNIVARKEEEDRLADEKAARERQEAWDSLLAVAREQMGAAVGEQPKEPPENFPFPRHYVDYVLWCQPFGEAQLLARFHYHPGNTDTGRDWLSVAKARPEGGGRYAVAIVYEALTGDPDVDDCVQVPRHGWAGTDSLPEAVAWCADLGGPSYRKAMGQLMEKEAAEVEQGRRDYEEAARAEQKRAYSIASWEADDEANRKDI